MAPFREFCPSLKNKCLRTIYKPHIAPLGVLSGLKESSCLRTVYKPHSVRQISFALCDHLSGRCVTAPLGAAYPELTSPPCEEVRMKTSSLPSSADDFVPAWPCSRRGLPGHPHYCGCRWSFTPPFHHHRPHPRPFPRMGKGANPLSLGEGHEGAVCFCGPCPAG